MFSCYIASSGWKIQKAQSRFDHPCRGPDSACIKERKRNI
jgi:hypothetical protein